MEIRKKTDNQIHIRITTEKKEKFVKLCDKLGVTPSEILNQRIDDLLLLFGLLEDWQFLIIVYTYTKHNKNKYISTMKINPNTKDDNVLVRISTQKKQQFKEICERLNTNQSEILIDYIEKLIIANKEAPKA